MAARFITISNFTGIYSVDESYFDTTIVEKTEEHILRDLLGDYQYRLFIADCGSGSVPATQKYKDLLNGKTYTDGFEKAYKGLVEMLAAFSFSALIREKSESNSTGFTKNLNQNSRVLNKFELEQLANKAYNNGVNLYQQAQSYILFYNSDFVSWISKRKDFRNLIQY